MRLSTILMYYYELIFAFISILFRHPETGHRPSFRDLIQPLTKTNDILQIPDLVVNSVPSFRTPGGSLDAGKNVYKDLQITYS